jgi:hypothetical protein
MKVLSQNYSTALLHPFQHICKLQIKISKREIPTYNRTYTLRPEVSTGFFKSLINISERLLQIFVPKIPSVYPNILSMRASNFAPK